MTEDDRIPDMSTQFDPLVLRAMTKWPNVPACYGWLALDRRGHWLLKGEAISHPGTVTFLDRHYAQEAFGAWYVQNGPQRVYVDLGYTPWVFRAQAGQPPVSHTKRALRVLRNVIVDDEQNLLLDTDIGIGLVDDRDLGALIATCSAEGPQSRSLDPLEMLLDVEGLQRESWMLRFSWYPQPVVCQYLPSGEMPRRFGYIRTPMAPDSGATT